MPISEETKLSSGFVSLSENLLISNTQLTTDKLIARYGLLERDLFSQTASEVIRPLPQKEDLQHLYDAAQLKTIHDRLYELGYLQNRQTVFSRRGPIPSLRRPLLNTSLKKAIKQFQLDANLTEDGWVGNVTWDALQQLVSFESPLQIERWLKSNGRFSRALCRAIKLRLAVFGLSSKPIYGNDYTEIDLRPFKIIARNLLREENLASEHDFINLLFDQDRLNELLIQVDRQYEINEFEKKFIIAFTKTELWLLDSSSEVKPDGLLNEKYTLYVGPPSNRRQIIKTRSIISSNNLSSINKESDFYQTLHKTWHLFAKDSGQSAKLSLNFLSHFQDFFTVLNNNHGISDKQLAQSVDNAMETDPNFLLMLHNEVKQIGNLLFDGITRALKFIGRLLRGAATKLLELAKAMARPFWKAINKTFAILKTSILSCKEAITFWNQDLLLQKNNYSIAIGKDKDADFRLLVDKNASEQDLREFVELMLRRSEQFSIAAKLLAEFLAVFKLILLTSLTGWFAFFKACIDLLKSGVQIVQLANQLDSLKGH